MILSMSDQVRHFLLTALMGAGAGVVYDFFRIVRRIFKHPDFLTHLEDFVYWSVISIALFYFLLHSNNGEIRVYAVVGVFIGMVLYFASVSRLILKIAAIVIDFLKKIIIIALKILFYPFRLLLRLLQVPAAWVKKSALKSARFGKKRLLNIIQYGKMKTRKTKRDLQIIQKKV